MSPTLGRRRCARKGNTAVREASRDVTPTFWPVGESGVFAIAEVMSTMRPKHSAVPLVGAHPQIGYLERDPGSILGPTLKWASSSASVATRNRSARESGKLRRRTLQWDALDRLVAINSAGSDRASLGVGCGRAAAHYAHKASNVSKPLGAVRRTVLHCRHPLVATSRFTARPHVVVLNSVL
jgi:hypothetical protein